MSLIATWHPTYAIFRNAYEHGSFRGDLARFARVIKGTTRPKPRELIINPTVSNIRHMFESSPGWVVTDIETAPEHKDSPWTGKDPTRAKLKAIGLGCPEWGLAFDCRENHVALRKEIQKWFASDKVTKVCHNGPWFDHRVLRRYGMPIVRWEDTRDARMALTPTSPLGLGYLGSLYDDVEPWKEDEEDDSKGLVFTDVIEDLLKYCAMDCVVTARVYEGIRAEQDWQEERVQRLYQLHKDLSVACAEMHTAGFKVNQLNRDYLAWILNEEYDTREAELLSLVNMPGFRCNDNDMRKLIFKRHETKDLNRFHLNDPLDPALFTDTGLCSVNFDALLQLLLDPYVPEELRTIIKVYWKAQEAWKARSTFVTSEKVNRAIGRDGRIRPGWNSCGTDTGRFSCSEPNIMNLQQFLRAMYCAEEGNVLVHADFSQLELRVMAAVSEDLTLTKALESGDVYGEDAKAIFGLPADMNVKKMKPKARQASKQVHLAFQYGAGPPKVYAQVLAEDFDAKYSDVARVHDAMKKRYAGTVAYWLEEQKRVLKDGYSESRVLQRRRAYPAEPPITEIANYPIQSTASDVMNLAFLRVRNRLAKEVPTGKIIDQLHDALDVECAENDQAKVSKILKEEFERPLQIMEKTYIFPVEIKVGKFWDEL